MKSKRDRFEVIAAKRVQKVLDDITSLEKCSNKNNYEYTTEDIKKMISTIKQKVKLLEDTFLQRLDKRANKNIFKF